MRDLMIPAALLFALTANGAALPDSSGLYSGFKRSLGATASHGYRTTTSPDPVREGMKSERFELRSGDCSAVPGWSDCASDRERSELAQRAPFSVPGKEYWYAWSLFVPDSYQNIFPVKVCLAQFHQQGAKSPPLMFQNGKGGYWLDLNQMRRKPALLIEDKDFRGRWHDILVNVRWSKSKNGFLMVWVNGELKYSETGANLIQNGPIYFKYGIYRSFLSRKKEKLPDQVVFFDAVRWGTKREDVEIPKP